MNPDQLAAIHGAAFTDSRGWSASEFNALLQSDLCFLVCEESGFALGRVIADEAELLTIATLPEAQGKGIGRRCLAAFQSEAEKRGAVTAFLEVAEDNTPAISLYESAGWETSGRRPKYYARSGRNPVDALLMTKSCPLVTR